MPDPRIAVAHGDGIGPENTGAVLRILEANLTPIEWDVVEIGERAYTPYIASLHPTMNGVILRENEQDLYAGIEYRQSQKVVVDLKVVTRPGSKSIICLDKINRAGVHIAKIENLYSFDGERGYSLGQGE